MRFLAYQKESRKSRALPIFDRHSSTEAFIVLRHLLVCMYFLPEGVIVEIGREGERGRGAVPLAVARSHAQN